MSSNPKEYARAYAREYYQRNKEHLSAKHKAYHHKIAGENPSLVLWRLARTRAIKFGLDFDIKVEDIVIPELCPVLGVPLKRKTKYAPSVDRVDPTKGYTKDNIAVISNLANKMKSNANPQELRDFAQWVLKTYQLS